MHDLELRAIGYIGNDAEIKHHNNRKAIQFSVATSESWKDAQGNKNERTTWVRCTLWREQNQSAAVADYLKKGTQVIVSGIPSIYAYANQTNGQPDAMLQLRVSNIKLLGGKKEQAQASPVAAVAAGNDEPDDLPF